MSTDAKSPAAFANPAVVGLAGFGMTTMVLQFHNLGWCGIAPVLWLGLVFGGSAQLIAGLMEFKKNNNFGFCAFTAYGAFWIATCLLLIFGKGATEGSLFYFTAQDLGTYLAVWGFFTLIMLIAARKHSVLLTLIFLTLTLGFFGLAIADFTGEHLIKQIAAYDLIACALFAWYGMAQAVFAEAGIKLPVGECKK